MRVQTTFVISFLIGAITVSALDATPLVNIPADITTGTDIQTAQSNSFAQSGSLATASGVPPGASGTVTTSVSAPGGATSPTGSVSVPPSGSMSTSSIQPSASESGGNATGGNSTGTGAGFRMASLPTSMITLMGPALGLFGAVGAGLAIFA